MQAKAIPKDRTPKYTNEWPVDHTAITVIERQPTCESEKSSSSSCSSESWVQYVGPDHTAAPHRYTVMWHLAFLIIFITFLGVAAKYPGDILRTVFTFISGLGFIGLVWIFYADLTGQRTSSG